MSREGLIKGRANYVTAGGLVSTPRTEIVPDGGMGAFAIFTDPVGVEFGLYEDLKR